MGTVYLTLPIGDHEIWKGKAACIPWQAKLAQSSADSVYACLLTAAILQWALCGQELPFAVSAQQPFERLHHSDTCQIAHAGESAIEAAVGNFLRNWTL